MITLLWDLVSNERTHHLVQKPEILSLAFPLCLLFNPITLLNVLLVGFDFFFCLFGFLSPMFESVCCGCGWCLDVYKRLGLFLQVGQCISLEPPLGRWSFQQQQCSLEPACFKATWKFLPIFAYSSAKQRTMSYFYFLHIFTLRNNYSSFSFCSMGKTWASFVADPLLRHIPPTEPNSWEPHPEYIYFCVLVVVGASFSSCDTCHFLFCFEPVLLHCWVVVEPLQERNNLRLAEDDSSTPEAFLWLCLAH